MRTGLNNYWLIPRCSGIWCFKQLSANYFSGMKNHGSRLRKCATADVSEMYTVINDAAIAYKGKIPADCWHEPYMPLSELASEIEDGIDFWGYERNGRLLGIMGIQDRGDVTLIRHAYVLTVERNAGIGSTLLRHLETLTSKQILIGTWKAATWAISFYRKNGYTLVTEEEKNKLLAKYWTISTRQIETSVVLAKPAANASGAR
jgi:N-acetylglutamate synthase-like GNAT family acetyltransferase